MEAKPLFASILTEKGVLALGKELASKLMNGDVIMLRGPLGSGKTVLARAIIRALLDRPRLEVPSPTFSLVQHYENTGSSGGHVRHFDLFRLKDEAELAALGLDNTNCDSIDLIEWPDRLGTMMPADPLTIALELSDKPGERRVSLTGSSNWQTRLTNVTSLVPA